MAATELQLKSIHSKLQQLLKEHQSLLRENQQLRQELDDIRGQYRQQQDSMNNLEQQVQVLKYTGGEMSEAERKEFEKKINSYVREIDRCITMLSQ
jgi:DNA topoisomerase IB